MLFHVECEKESEQVHDVLPSPAELYSLASSVCPCEVSFTKHTVKLFATGRTRLPIRKFVLSPDVTDFPCDIFHGLSSLSEIDTSNNKTFQWSGTYLYSESAKKRDIIVFRKDRPINVSILVDKEIRIRSYALENCRYISLLSFEKPDGRDHIPLVTMEPNSVGDTRVVSICVSGFVTNDEASEIFHNDSIPLENGSNQREIEWLTHREGFIGAFNEIALREARVSLYPKELSHREDNFGISETVGECTPITNETAHACVLTEQMKSLREKIDAELSRFRGCGLIVGKNRIDPVIYSENKASLRRMMDTNGRAVVQKEIAGDFDTEKTKRVLSDWQDLGHNMLYFMDLLRTEVSGDRVLLLADDAGETLKDVLDAYWELKGQGEEADKEQLDASIRKIQMGLFAMFFVIWRLNHNVLGGYMSHKLLAPGNVFFTGTENKVTGGFYPLALDELGCRRDDLKYIHPALLKRVKRADLIRYFGAAESDGAFTEFEICEEDEQELQKCCPEADMWSLGILLYELLRGERIPEIDSLSSFYKHIEKWDNLSQNFDFQRERTLFDPIFREILEVLLGERQSDMILGIEAIEHLLLGPRDTHEPTAIEKLFDRNCQKSADFEKFMAKGIRAIERTRNRVTIH